MILIIGGLFTGLCCVLSYAQLGWFLPLPLLGAVLLIAAGVDNLRNGRPEEVIDAINKLERDARKK